MVGGIASLFASSNPDGLEWSISKVAGEALDMGNSNQPITSLLPDYSFGNEDVGFLGTSFSGIIGAGLVLIVCVAVFYLIKYIRKRGKNE